MSGMMYFLGWPFHVGSLGSWLPDKKHIALSYKGFIVFP